MIWVRLVLLVSLVDPLNSFPHSKPLALLNVAISAPTGGAN
jgi:hypothetical protein